MQHSFPQSKSTFLKATDFQDTDKILTYQGWDKRANENREARGKMPASTWQQNLKFCLKYSYPEYAIDPATGEKRLDSGGQPFKNSNYDENFPHGYMIVYNFDEGVFESGSSPLFKAFCKANPKPGDILVITRTGQKEETKWSVSKVKNAFPKDDVPSRDVNEFRDSELEPDEDLPPF